MVHLCLTEAGSTLSDDGQNEKMQVICLPCDHVPPAGGVGAGRALVRLLPRVGPLVRGEVVRSAEHLLTHPAGVGLESGVETHMPRQHVAPREAPPADLTEVGLGRRLRLVGLVARGHVLCQTIVEGELLPTNRAPIGGLRWS